LNDRDDVVEFQVALLKLTLFLDWFSQLLPLIWHYGMLSELKQPKIEF